MVGNEGVEPNHATANQAFERKSFTDFRLEHFPKMEREARFELANLGFADQCLAV